MKRTSDLKLILFFTALTFLLTAGVVFAWEKFLLPPFYSWVDARYPGEANTELRWKMQQRVEHFFISIAVDMVVVTLLLRVVRRQQRTAAATETRYRALFEHADVGIAFVRADDGVVIEANRRLCEILGRAQPCVDGRSVRELFPPERAEDAAKLEAVVSPAGGAAEADLSVRTAASAVPLHVSFNVLPTDGERLGILFARDLTARERGKAEREEMQRQLYQSSKLASGGELAAGVAHEINNPLNGVINFAQLLKDDGAARTDFERQLLDGIIDEGERIAQIVRGLLTFARHEAPGMQPVSIDETLETSVALFGRQLERDGISLEVEIEPGLPDVRADASRLRQVVVNMISNAHHALRAKPAAPGEGKVLRISARRADAEDGAGPVVLLEFYDNGVGVRDGDMARLFDPFFTTRRDSGGTGLGLSISFGIVRDHGGSIRVESEEGRFTRFIVELPAAARARGATGYA
jgi:PAS domain S-box-containing protein